MDPGTAPTLSLAVESTSSVRRDDGIVIGEGSLGTPGAPDMLISLSTAEPRDNEEAAPVPDVATPVAGALEAQPSALLEASFGSFPTWSGGGGPPAKPPGGLSLKQRFAQAGSRMSRAMPLSIPETAIAANPLLSALQRGTAMLRSEEEEKERQRIRDEAPPEPPPQPETPASPSPPPPPPSGVDDDVAQLRREVEGLRAEVTVAKKVAEGFKRGGQREELRRERAQEKLRLLHDRLESEHDASTAAVDERDRKAEESRVLEQEVEAAKEALQAKDGQIKVLKAEKRRCLRMVASTFSTVREVKNMMAKAVLSALTLLASYVDESLTDLVLKIGDLEFTAGTAAPPPLLPSAIFGLRRTTDSLVHGLSAVARKASGLASPRASRAVTPRAASRPSGPAGEEWTVDSNASSTERAPLFVEAFESSTRDLEAMLKDTLPATLSYVQRLEADNKSLREGGLQQQRAHRQLEQTLQALQTEHDTFVAEAAAQRREAEAAAAAAAEAYEEAARVKAEETEAARAAAAAAAAAAATAAAAEAATAGRRAAEAERPSLPPAPQALPEQPPPQPPPQPAAQPCAQASQEVPDEPPSCVPENLYVALSRVLGEAQRMNLSEKRYARLKELADSAMALSSESATTTWKILCRRLSRSNRLFHHLPASRASLESSVSRDLLATKAAFKDYIVFCYNCGDGPYGPPHRRCDQCATKLYYSVYGSIALGSKHAVAWESDVLKMLNETRGVAEKKRALMQAVVRELEAGGVPCDNAAYEACLQYLGLPRPARPPVAAAAAAAPSHVAADETVAPPVPLDAACGSPVSPDRPAHGAASAELLRATYLQRCRQAGVLPERPRPAAQGALRECLSVEGRGGGGPGTPALGACGSPVGSPPPAAVSPRGCWPASAVHETDSQCGRRSRLVRDVLCGTPTPHAQRPRARQVPADLVVAAERRAQPQMQQGYGTGSGDVEVVSGEESDGGGVGGLLREEAAATPLDTECSSSPTSSALPSPARASVPASISIPSTAARSAATAAAAREAAAPAAVPRTLGEEPPVQTPPVAPDPRQSFHRLVVGTPVPRSSGGGGGGGGRPDSGRRRQQQRPRQTPDAAVASEPADVAEEFVFLGVDAAGVPQAAGAPVPMETRQAYAPSPPVLYEVGYQRAAALGASVAAAEPNSGDADVSTLRVGAAAPASMVKPAARPSSARQPVAKGGRSVQKQSAPVRTQEQKTKTKTKTTQPEQTVEGFTPVVGTDRGGTLPVASWTPGSTAPLADVGGMYVSEAAATAAGKNRPARPRPVSSRLRVSAHAVPQLGPAPVTLAFGRESPLALEWCAYKALVEKK